MEEGLNPGFLQVWSPDHLHQNLLFCLLNADSWVREPDSLEWGPSNLHFNNPLKTTDLCDAEQGDTWSPDALDVEVPHL